MQFMNDSLLSLDGVWRLRADDESESIPCTIPGELRALAAYASVLGSISFLTSRYLAFPGLDRLERLGAGSMGYPVVVASCIFGFFPYGLLVLHERIDLHQSVGAVLCIAGIILGCIR